MRALKSILVRAGPLATILLVFLNFGALALKAERPVISTCKSVKSVESMMVEKHQTVLTIENNLHFRDFFDAGSEKRAPLKGFHMISVEHRHFFFSWPACLADSEPQAGALRRQYGSSRAEQELALSALNDAAGTAC